MFALEKDMTPIVAEWLEGQFDIVQPELKCGYVGRYAPDFVAANFDMQKLKSRKRTTAMPRRRIEKSILSLELPVKCHTDLVAVELKLKNFPQAYFQAKICNSYGMRTYIAMPLIVAANQDIIRKEVMEFDGIGLIGVSDKIKVLIEARRSAVSSVLEEIQIIERLIPKIKLKREGKI